jgi:hypothetical protein
MEGRNRSPADRMSLLLSSLAPERRQNKRTPSLMELSIDESVCAATDTMIGTCRFSRTACSSKLRRFSGHIHLFVAGFFHRKISIDSALCKFQNEDRVRMIAKEDLYYGT